MKIKTLLLLATFFLASCGAMPSDTKEPKQKTTKLKECTLTFSNNQRLSHIPLAQTEQQQQKGLSGNPPVNNKMLFIFMPAQETAFWMKDTHIPLSIGFFNEEGFLYQIDNMEANSEALHPTRGKITVALELKQGQFEAQNIPLGVRLTNIDCDNKNNK